METRVKSNVKEQECYLLEELENMVELTVLIRNAETKLKSCPCCGAEGIERIKYRWRKNMDGKFCHYFQIACTGNQSNGKFGCGIQTFEHPAGDSVESIQSALDFISTKWNRRPDLT